MKGWQPISTAPKDGTPILMYIPTHKEFGLPAIEINDWYEIEQIRYEPAKSGLFRKVFDEPITGWNGNGHNATHWMPLPDPPKDET